MPERIQAVERAAAILRLLATGPGRLGVVDLARALDLPKGTVHGILATLQHVGFVEQDQSGRKYRLGPELLHLGNSYLDVNELRARALTWAGSLATATGETVRVGALHGDRVLVVHHVLRPDDSFPVPEVGTLLPLHATALGKALLATAPDRDTLLADLELPAKTPRTKTTRRALTTALTRVVARGWAEEVEELSPGVAAVAAPITDDRGVTVGAVDVSGAVERLCDGSGAPRTELVTAVRDAARAISRHLGARHS